VGFGLIERVYDKDRIKPIVLSMIGDVIEDGTSHECFDLNVKRDCWLSCDDYSALFHIKAFNRTTLDLHCYIPKKNRGKSIEYGKEALNWIKESAPDMYKKVVTQSPSIYRHIKIYLLKMGFTLEGCYTSSFLKNGKVWDLNLFGLKRCDI
jgi:hypothetical protein